jgi:nicotinamide riboside transporter PnuC
MSRYNDLDYVVSYYKNRKQKQHNMKNWRTTLVGALLAVLTIIQPLIEDGTVTPIRIAIAGAIALLGYLMKDFSVTGTGR